MNKPTRYLGHLKMKATKYTYIMMVMIMMMMVVVMMIKMTAEKLQLSNIGEFYSTRWKNDNVYIIKYPTVLQRSYASWKQNKIIFQILEMSLNYTKSGNVAKCTITIWLLESRHESPAIESWQDDPKCCLMDIILIVLVLFSMIINRRDSAHVHKVVHRVVHRDSAQIHEVVHGVG